MSKKPLIYKSPKDLYGKPYWVPIVMKNKDTLIGYLNGMYIVTDQLGVDPESFIATLSSERFNDTLRDGRKGSKITDDDFKEYIKEIVIDDIEKTVLRETHEGCSPLILDEYFLGISCNCGNFYGYKDPKDIPDTTLKCDMCNKLVIDYTEKDEDEFAYDGIQHLERDLEGVIEEVRSELNLDDDDDDEDDSLF